MSVDDVRQQIAVIDRRVIDIEADLASLKTSVYGDTTMRILGLLDQFGALSTEIASLRKDLSELLTWRREVTLLMRAGLAILSVGGGAQVIALLKAWGG
jgi:hypothetical protein